MNVIVIAVIVNSITFVLKVAFIKYPGQITDENAIKSALAAVAFAIQ